MSNSIYIQNKYLNWYNSIIFNIRNQDRKKFQGIYYENHHIIPKSFGGSNSKDNLVLLTAKEHFICHHLLTKFTTGDQYNSMIMAFFMMNNCKNEKYNNYSKLTSKQYEVLRTKYSNYLKNKTITEETKLKISISSTGRKHSKETKLKISRANSGKNSGMYGVIVSEETKLKISKKSSGKNNANWNGYYHTPFGIFEAPLHQKNLPRNTLVRYCKNNNRIINNHLISCSKYLQSLNESPIGKTFYDIGFWFELK